MSRKINLKILGGPSYEVRADRILCNDINLPGSPGFSHGPKLYLLISTYGPMGAVWAYSEDEAVDVLVDSDLAKAIEVDREYINENTAYAGNDSRPVDLSSVGIGVVDLQADLLKLFWKAEESEVNNLSEL